jgi:hypothetical protein
MDAAVPKNKQTSLQKRAWQNTSNYIILLCFWRTKPSVLLPELKHNWMSSIKSTFYFLFLFQGLRERANEEQIVVRGCEKSVAFREK